jgi:hypothetical protein
MTALCVLLPLQALAAAPDLTLFKEASTLHIVKEICDTYLQNDNPYITDLPSTLALAAACANGLRLLLPLLHEILPAKGPRSVTMLLPALVACVVAHIEEHPATPQLQWEQLLAELHALGEQIWVENWDIPKIPHLCVHKLDTEIQTFITSVCNSLIQKFIQCRVLWGELTP